MACMQKKKDFGRFEVGNNRCLLCRRLDIDRCCCAKFHDQQHVDSLWTKCTAHIEDALDVGYRRLDSALKQSRMLSNPAMADHLINPSHTLFEPQNKTQRKQHAQLAQKELELRCSADALNTLLAQPLSAWKE